MAYRKLNERSIRLFAATPEELAKKRPNLNAPYFRVKREDLEALLSVTDGDVVLSLGVWKRQGRDGKPDYFTADISYPDDPEVQAKYIAKDDEWKSAHPHQTNDAEARKRYAMNKQAAEKVGLDEDFEPPF